MIVCVDFDATVVSDARAYADLRTALRLLPWAKAGLLALKRAGHTLVLYSARANRALRESPSLDPLVRAGVRRVDEKRWARDRLLHEARYQEMLRFVERELPGIFDAVDDGVQGKPVADLFIDDRVIRYGHGVMALDWRGIAQQYGHVPLYAVEGRGRRTA